MRQRAFPDDEMRALVGVLVVADQLNAALDEACGTFGITHFQYNVLRMLRGAASTGLTRREIEERIITRATDVTRLLDRLVERELVVRERGAVDRRTSVARVTAAGLEVLAKADTAVEEVRMRVFGALDPSQLATLGDLLASVLDVSK